MADGHDSWRAQLREGLEWLRDAPDNMIAPRAVQKQRYAICTACEHFNHTIKQCRVCDCFMPVKTRLAFVACPKDKWHPVSGG